MNLRTRKRRRGRMGSGVESLETRTLLAADLLAVEATDSGVALNFSEPVAAGPGTGRIILSDATDGAVLEKISVSRADINGSVVTVAPKSNIPAGTTVAVNVDAGAFVSGTDVATSTIYSEDFETVELQNSLLVPPFDDYAAVFTGTLDVTVAGEYTFGVNSDDGQTLAIDFAGDGLDFIDDEVIYDNNNHGRQDRLSTCGVDAAIESCEGTGEGGIEIAVGQYDFGYVYYERGGGSGGEFFYAPGNHEVFDPEAFAIVGDDSKGIGISGNGITVTIYKETADNQIADLTTAESVIEDESLIIGTASLEYADVAENPGGRFDFDNEIPGADEWAAENDENPFDWSDVGPDGWTRDTSDLIEGGAQEYNGWTWLNKEFWIAEQGDQSRTEYELAEGTVLVADPDAHDDYVDNGGFDQAACLTVLEFGAECGLFTASVDTPPISLAGVTENTATLQFASSWWDEDVQSAEARVQYFDAEGNTIGDPHVLLRWESIPDSENYKPVTDPDTGENARNEVVTVELENPAGAMSAIITFDMPYATNDWWWAIDNIEVSGEVTGSLFAGTVGDSFTFEASTTSSGPDGASVGDLDGNGVVEFADFLILSSNFGNSGSPAEGDTDGNGEIDFTDFLVISANFGKTVDQVFGELG